MFNYGGQLEIADACKKIINKGISADKITPELIANNLYCPDIPSLDLVMHASGEQRISNFMLWRAAYSVYVYRQAVARHDKRRRRFDIK